jgi:Uncharacterised protein conserved in bacteria (DUF2336)
MTKTPPAFVQLEGLLDLDPRGGVDMRPTLLRVLTDLYLQKSAHSADDERYFTELALRLIDATDVGARSSLATRLASYASAPHDVIARLARDEIEVAEPILRCSPCLTAADLAAIVKDCGPAHAKVIAARNVPPAPERTDAAAATDGAENPSEASELTELFYTADAVERRLILMNLEYAAFSPPPLAATLERKDVWRLESAALQHNLEAVVREFERVLGISHQQARRVLQDESGEPIVAAAKAMELPSDVLQRMLLFVNPRIGESINRVYELAGLYGEITVDAARRMIAILRDGSAEPTEHRAPRHEPLAWRNAAENARRALSEIVHRPAMPGAMIRSGSGQR